MTAPTIREAIQASPPEDLAGVVEYLRRVENPAMPASFLEALGEVRDGKTILITDEHFDAPPA